MSIPAPVTTVEALLFDLGGVLIEIDFDRAFTHWARRSGIDAGRLREAFRQDEAYERHERGEIGPAEYFASLRRSLALELPDEAIDEGWGSIFGHEMPGIPELLASLAGKAPLYVFSNTNVAHQRVWAPRFEPLLRHFRQVFVSCELGKRKPAPEAFHAVARAIDVPPERILFFDDTPANVRGALAVGMQAVHVRSIRDIERAVEQCRWSTHIGRTR